MPSPLKCAVNAAALVTLLYLINPRDPADEFSSDYLVNKTKEIRTHMEQLVTKVGPPDYHNDLTMAESPLEEVY